MFNSFMGSQAQANPTTPTPTPTPQANQANTGGQPRPGMPNLSNLLNNPMLQGMAQQMMNNPQMMNMYLPCRLYILTITGRKT
jgi:hypothetical protein